MKIFKIKGKLARNSLNTDEVPLRNLAQPYVNHEIKTSFIRVINQLTLSDDGETVVLDELKVGNTRPFWVNKAEDLTPKKIFVQ